MAAPPEVRAFSLGDAVSRDPSTGKASLNGTFDKIAATSFPVTHGEFADYFKLSDLNGDYVFEVVFLAPDLTTELARLSFEKTTFTNPLDPVDGAVNFPNLVLDVPGKYAVRLVCHDPIADQFSLDVVKLP